MSGPTLALGRTTGIALNRSKWSSPKPDRQLPLASNDRQKPARVLIVEDEAVVQLHLRRLLGELGYDVCGVAATAADALRVADEQRPDAVLMDVHLQGGDDGIATAALLQSRIAAAFVFITAYADEETVRRAQEAGAAGYVVKPFTREQVHAVLATALSGHDRLADIRRREQALRSALTTRGDGILVADADGSLSFINDRVCDVLGCSDSGWVGRPLRDLLADTLAGDCAVVAAIDRAQASKSAQVFDGVATTCRGIASRRVSGEVDPLFDADGSPGGLLIVVRDGSAPRHVTAPVERRPFGDGTRMLIYSHDTFGLGHLQRCLSLSRALLDAFPKLSILLVTGSAVVQRFRLPPGLDYVKLPAVRKVASERYEARTLHMSEEGVWRLRTNILTRTIRDYDPDVLLVDHSPIGMRGELRPGLEWLRANRPGCVCVLGLRDILDDGASVRALWEEQGIYDVLRDAYQRVVVYGSREVYDVPTEYAFPPELRDKTQFLSYVVDPRPWESLRSERSRPSVAVTIGGGDGASELVEAYIDMLRAYRDRVRFDSVILAGPLTPQAAIDRFRAAIEGLPAVVHEFVESTSPYLSAADLVISTAGYNTVVQALRYAKRAILVPRVLHRQEQLLRATRLQSLGLVSVLLPKDMESPSLFAAVDAALSQPGPPIADALARAGIELDGARQFAELCRRLRVGGRETMETVND